MSANPQRPRLRQRDHALLVAARVTTRSPVVACAAARSSWLALQLARRGLRCDGLACRARHRENLGRAAAPQPRGRASASLQRLSLVDASTSLVAARVTPTAHTSCDTRDEGRGRTEDLVQQLRSQPLRREAQVAYRILPSLTIDLTALCRLPALCAAVLPEGQWPPSTRRGGRDFGTGFRPLASGRLSWEELVFRVRARRALALSVRVRAVRPVRAPPPAPAQLSLTRHGHGSDRLREAEPKGAKARAPARCRPELVRGSPERSRPRPAGRGCPLPARHCSRGQGCSPSREGLPPHR